MGFLRRLFNLHPDEEKEASPAVSTLHSVGEDVAATMEVEASAEESAAAPAPPAPSAFGGTRQLPPLETALTKPNQHIVIGHSTDVGMVRSNNQDSTLAFFASQSSDDAPDFGLFIVADGMGGHLDGEKASSMAASVMAEQVAQRILLPMLKQHPPNGLGGDADQPTVSEILAEAMQAANDVVLKDVPDGGTTVTAAAVLGDLAYIAHVGDSRAYLVTQESGIEQITRDHSLVQRLIELDQLTKEEADSHPQRNVLYRAIGQSETLEVDSITRRLPANSSLLICSDGLWNMVPEEDMLDVVLNVPIPQDACDRLVFLANERGGADNISAILLRVPG